MGDSPPVNVALVRYNAASFLGSVDFSQNSPFKDCTGAHFICAEGLALQ